MNYEKSPQKNYLPEEDDFYHEDKDDMDNEGLKKMEFDDSNLVDERKQNENAEPTEDELGDFDKEENDDSAIYVA